jgi:hypothetical protein
VPHHSRLFPSPSLQTLVDLVAGYTGDGAKCGAKFADTPHVIYVKVTGVHSE